MSIFPFNKGLQDAIDKQRAENLQKALRAALNGPEVKKVNLFGHEFNVKKIKVTRNNGGVLAEGRLSHHLTGRPDDQVDYTITRPPNAAKPTIKWGIKRGGWAPIAAAGAGLAALVYDLPAAQSAQATLKLGRELGKLIDGNWEKAAKRFLQVLAETVK